MKNSQIWQDITRIHSILVGIATGTKIENPIQIEYQNLRQKLILNSQVKTYLPEFVVSCRHLNEFWGFIKPKFTTYAERRHFLAQSFDRILTEIESGNLAHLSVIPQELAQQTLQEVESSILNKTWEKTISRQTNDPDGALTASRSLLESVIKHILDDLHEPYSEKDDLPNLYGKMATKLKLSPKMQDEEILKRFLGGCQGIVEGIGIMRNKLGDAHGKGRGSLVLDAKLIELVINMSQSLSIYWIKVYKEFGHATRSL